MVDDEHFVDVTELVGSQDWSPMIAAWDEVGTMIAERTGYGRPARLDEVLPRPALVSPRARVFALGSNFPDHAAAAKSVILGREVTEAEVLAERDQNLPPWGFTVIPETVIADGGTVVAPPGTEMLDYEVEVCAVLAAGGRHIDPAELRLWGYTAWNDLGVRDHYFGRGPAHDRGILTWCLQKNFMGSNACGPWMVVDEPYDPGKVRVSTRVNGEPRQDSSTAEMIWSFGDTAAHLSAYLDLLPGDAIVSGTPAGTAVESGPDGPYLRPGDRVEVEVEGVGVLTTLVGAP
jgi:2-keto-4-pentenoate hydratase/2-oxohepta-3-ene-1,7-dioic acid hydratase in catechol pathway